MDEAVFFGSAVEGLFVRALGSRLDPAARERIRQVGIDLDRPPLPAYPVGVWERAVEVAAQSAFPGLPAEEAWQATGRAFMFGFNETLLGRAVLGVGRVVGIERSLHRMTRNMRSVNNFTASQIERSQPGLVQIFVTTTPTFRELPRGGNLMSAHYMGGVFRGLPELLGGQEVRVEMLEVHPTRRDSRFQVTWRA